MGDILRNLRCANFLMQEQLGNYLNISQQTISKWENDITLPTFAVIITLSKLYNVNLETFDP